MSNQWALVDEDRTGSRTSAGLFYVPALKKVVLTGGNVPADVPYAQALDTGSMTWTALSAEKPAAATAGSRQRSLIGGAVAACDGETGRIYFLARDRLVVFDAAAGRWSTAGDRMPDRLLFPTMACDPVKKQVIVAGCGTEPDDVGWTVTLAFDPKAGTWRRLGPEKDEKWRRFAQDRAALDALADLIGRIRHAWYRHPKGEGTAAEREDLTKRCSALDGVAAFKPHAADVKRFASLIAARQLLQALEAARDLEGRLRREVEARAPVPPARARSPIACDPAKKVMVLFGGDRQESITNDTWLLDLTTETWRRAKPAIAPSPRAGHSIAYLPGCRRIALWDGYRQRNSLEYWSAQWEPLPQRELWLYDVKADRWDLLRAWKSSSKMVPGSREEPSRMRPDRAQPVFLGFTNDSGRYEPTVMAADGADNLVVSAPGPKRAAGRRRLSATWVLPVDAGRVDAAATKQRGAAPDQVVKRPGKYLASYCDSAEPSPALGLEALKPNVWTRLPDPPRNPLGGQRKKDWSTAVWNPDGDEILYFGGGHCNGAYSAPIHWSPASNRFAEGYDTEEQYGHNGASGATILGRPWVHVHGYLNYDYDVVAKRLVLIKMNGATYLYDPLRMDWERATRANPFWAHPYLSDVIGTPHGAVVWAIKGETPNREGDVGLWRLDLETGWKPMPLTGKLPPATTDGHVSCYESKRDRLILMSAPGYGIQGDGSIGFYDFKTGQGRVVKPENAEFAAVKPSIREMVYVEHADVALLLKDVTRQGKTYYPVYDCAADRWTLLDLGPGPGWNHGMVYDAVRRLIFVIGPDGQRWALRLDPRAAPGLR